jgi:hypothetical protein
VPKETDDWLEAENLHEFVTLELTERAGVATTGFGFPQIARIIEAAAIAVIAFRTDRPIE